MRQCGMASSRLPIFICCDLVLMGRESRRLVVVSRQRTGFDEVCAGVGERGGVGGESAVIMSQRS